MENTEFELECTDSQTIFDSNYDLVIFAIGYERRASELLNRRTGTAKLSIAFGFDYGLEISFIENEQAFKEKNVQLKLNLNDSQFQIELRTQLKLLSDNWEKATPITMLVDISCFNRTRLASIVAEISDLAERHTVIVDFFYAIARFKKPSNEFISNSIVDAIHPFFSGWSRVPANATSAIIGMGYEQGQALGAIEYIQANPVWAFSPISAESQYAPAVQKANLLLLEELPIEKIISYSVEKPLETFRNIEGLARGLLQDYNVVIVPFGPKMFVLISLLVAWRNRSVAVWRVSPGTEIQPVQRESSGHFSAIRIQAKTKTNQFAE
ncbi:MAG: hypothetical protein HY254_03095 [Burkholderiales bacterium]|nr:hypothetical protein [Burkholderiales bacterium]